MVFGGAMMLGIGLLMMLIVFGLPTLLIAGMIAGLIGLWGRPARPVSSPPTPTRQATTTPPARFCAHCGQGLQADWTRCPKCGAPAEAK